MKRAEGNFMMATNVRNKYARKIFSPTAVAAAIDEVAFQGYRHYRIVQELPFDLSETEAARALEEWLDGEQFCYVWRPTFGQPDLCRPLSAAEYPELVISW